MPRALPSRDQVTMDTPLRLDVAAALAFPDGSIKLSSLRREDARGRLTVWRIAGKDMTSLHEIEAMKERCRLEPKDGSHKIPERKRAREVHLLVSPTEAAMETAERLIESSRAPFTAPALTPRPQRLR